MYKIREFEKSGWRIMEVVISIALIFEASKYEQRHEKTGFLHMRKQSCRSASR